MADVDLLPSRGVPYLALVDANGIAIGGTSTIALLASKGMKAICQVDPTGLASSDGTSTIALLASRGIRAFAAVDETGLSTDDGTSRADVIRSRGIRPMVPLDVNGIAQTGSSNIPTLAQRGLGYFCPVDETGTAGSLIPVPPNTIRARPGIFTLTGETMTPITGYSMTSQFGAFSVINPGTTVLRPPVAVTTVWDQTPARVPTLVTFPTTLQAAYDFGGAQGTVSSNTSHSTGQYYFEVTLVFGSIAGPGIGNASMPVNGFVGLGVNSFGCFQDGTANIAGSNGPGTGTTFTSGQTVGIAIDFTTQKCWTRVGSGNWNNAAIGSQNPVGAIGGYSFAAMTGGGPFFAVAFNQSGGSSNTANFGPTYAATKPTGYSDW